MITEETKKAAQAIIEFIDKHIMSDVEDFDWEKTKWIGEIQRMVHNLEYSQFYFKPLTEEQISDRYYLAECDNCGWRGCSSYLLGGAAIGDTGDYDDCTCPICDSFNISVKD